MVEEKRAQYGGEVGEEKGEISMNKKIGNRKKKEKRKHTIVGVV